MTTRRTGALALQPRSTIRPVNAVEQFLHPYRRQQFQTASPAMRKVSRRVIKLRVPKRREKNPIASLAIVLTILH